MPSDVDLSTVKWDTPEPVDPSKVKWDTSAPKPDEVVWDDDIQSENDIQQFEEEAFVEEQLKQESGVETQPELYNEPPKWAEGGGIGTNIYAGLGAAKETLMPIAEGIAWGAGDIAKLAGPVGAAVSGAGYMTMANITKQAEIGLGTSPPETVEQTLKREATDFAVGATAGPVLSALGHGTVKGVKVLGEAGKRIIGKITGKGIPKKEIVTELAKKSTVKELTKLIDDGLKSGEQLELNMPKIATIQMELDLMKKGAETVKKTTLPSLKGVEGTISKPVEVLNKNIPTLIAAKTIGQGSQIFLEFDNMFKVPKAEELKAIIEKTLPSIRVSVTLFKKDIISGARGGTNFRIDVFDGSLGTMSSKKAQEVLFLLTRGTEFRSKTTKMMNLNKDNLLPQSIKEKLSLRATKIGEEITEQLPLSLIGKKLKHPKTGMFTGKRAFLYDLDKKAYQESLMLEVPSYANPELPYTGTANIIKEKYFDDIVKGFSNLTDDIVKMDSLEKAVASKVGVGMGEGVSSTAEPTLKKVMNNGFNNIRSGEKYKGDLGPIGGLLNWFQSSTSMSRVHPISRQIVRKGLEIETRASGFNVAFLKRIDRYGRGLKDKEWDTVIDLLYTYHDIDSVPPEVRKKFSDSILYTFDKVRKEVLLPIARIHKLGTKGKPLLLHEYAPRLYDDIRTLSPKEQRQIIYNFASEHRITYQEALDFFSPTLVKKGIPKEGFFGPLSKERTLITESEALKPLRIKGRRLLELYIKGASNKWKRDKFLPFAREAVKEIPENSFIHSVTERYIKEFAGAPSWDSAFWQKSPRFNQILVKVSRFEAMRQFTSKIALNWSPLIWNTTQYPINDGTKAIAAAIKGRSKGPLVDFARAMTGLITRRGRLIGKKIGLDVGQAEIPIRDIHGAMAKIAHTTGTLFRVSERNNKVMSRLRVYDNIYKSLDKSMSVGEKRQLARELSIELIDETQFLMGTHSPEILKGPVLGTLGRFKIFPIRTIEFFKNLSTTEKLVYIGLLDLMGGPRTIPGLRQLHFELKLSDPKDPFVKMLDTFATDVLDTAQDFSVTGGINAVTGYDLDLGRHIGLGFLPGVSLDEPWWTELTDNFYGKVGEILEGPTVSGIRNVYKDIMSGNLDPRDKGWAEFFNTPSMNEIGVGIKKTARAFEELDNKFIKYSRDRRGPELKDDVTVYLRILGVDIMETVNQTIALRYKEKLIEKANEKKVELLDRRIDLETMLKKSKTQADRLEVVNKIGENIREMGKFNQENYSTLGVKIDEESLSEAYKNRQRSLVERVMGNKIQEYRLRQDIEKLKQDK